MQAQILIGNTMSALRWRWRVVMAVREHVCESTGRTGTQLLICGHWYWRHQIGKTRY